MNSDSAEKGVILVVDDTPTNLEVLFNLLGTSGFRVLVAEDGASAIQKANYALPDLILLDIRMPKLDGFETCRRLKASAATKAIPIIFLSALTDTEDKVKGFNLGAVDFITKPLQYEEVLVRVETHLRLQRLTQQLRIQNEQLEREIAERQRIEAERLALLERDRLARLEAETARQQAKTILESITDAFVEVDHEWRYTYVNQQAERLLQRQRQELLGRRIWDVFPEAVNSVFYEQYHKAVAEQTSIIFEAFYPPLDAWSEVHAYPSKNGLSIYFQDITERKRSQEALRQSEARFRRLFEADIIGIFFATLSGNVTNANDAFLQMVGYTHAELHHGLINWDAMTPLHAHDENQAAFAQLLEAGACVPFEQEFICKDGSHLPVVVGAALLDRPPIEPNQFTEPMVVAFVLDLSARKQAENALQRQNWRVQLFSELALKIRQSLNIEDILQTTVTELQTAFQFDRALILRLLPNGQAKVVTEAVAPGCTSIIERNITDDCFGPEYLQKYVRGRVYSIIDRETASVVPCLVNFMREFEIRAKLVVPILLKDELWGLLIAHQCAKPRQWTDFETELLQQLADQIGIALTQAQLLEQETRQHLELSRSNTELQQFAYIASHDLQEPLRMVTSYLQLLQRRYQGKLDADADDFIGYAVDGATRMRTLIHDLLTYSRIGTRGQPFELIDCAGVVEQAMNNLKIAIEESNATIRYANLPRLMADPMQLTQLFQNLIGNAIKFRSDALPIVTIRATLQAGAWLFSVQDNGIGIDSQYNERIFVIFQRLHNRTEYQGTGIGLAVCKKIVERHGGEIWVQSRSGSGATFYFTIPAGEPS